MTYSQTINEKPTPFEILNLLLDGNKRFVEGKLTYKHTDIERRALASQTSQSKYAIATVLSCSDSRVPPELIFDCGIMDLFVVRLAGNILCEHSLATIEYGVLHVHTPLLLVMAHSQCGAVTGTVENYNKILSSTQSNKEEERLHRLMRSILPSIQKRINESNSQGIDLKNIIDMCAKDHAISIAKQIYEESKSIAERVDAGVIKIVPTFYNLSNGKIEILQS